MTTRSQALPNAVNDFSSRSQALPALPGNALSSRLRLPLPDCPVSATASQHKHPTPQACQRSFERWSIASATDRLCSHGE
jgi:hypothetical protein